MDQSLPASLPVGTSVVTREAVTGRDRQRVMPAGSVASVVRSPDDPGGRYLLRFAGGQEAEVTRGQIDVLRHYQQRETTQRTAAAEHDLFRYVIYRCIVGSRAYGLEHAFPNPPRRNPPCTTCCSGCGVRDTNRASHHGV